MRLSARGAQKTREESRKLQMYSKQWTPGDTLHVWYPLYWENGQPEVAVGAVWGHSVGDIKELGLHTAFIPSTTDFDENGLPVGSPDITYQFSRIANIFRNGAKAAEIAAIMRKKGWPSDSAKEAALDDVKKKYDTKNNRNAVKPIIGRATYYISTEVVCVKIANGGVVTDTATVCSAPMSNTLINKIYALMRNPKFRPQEGDEFFEVEFIYPVDPDKGTSGRQVTISGCTPEYCVVNQYPDQYPMIAALFPTVSREEETIRRRATTTINPERVKEALTAYSMMHSEDLDAVSDERDVETLTKNADIIAQLNFIGALENTDLSAKLQEAIDKMNAYKPAPAMEGSVPAPTLPSNNTTEAPATSVADEPEMPATMPEMPINDAAPHLAELMMNQNNVGAGDQQMLDDIDLDLV